jgi:hypothetical protein
MPLSQRHCHLCSVSTAIDFDVASCILSLINTTRCCPVSRRDVSAQEIRCKELETNVNHPLSNFPCTRLTPQVVT